MLHKEVGSGVRRAPIALGCLLAIVLILSSSIVPASAKLWASHDESDRESIIQKPVDPVFIGANETIFMEKGEEWSLYYHLEAGKRYHVFLVGEWINNGTEPVTDYDIYTYTPNGLLATTHTESAGLPEQVANDERHQYYVPETTGDYRFRIINDPRDSKNNHSAVFMLIEHIDTNVRYTRFLEGRNEDDEELLNTGWAYELNTSAPRIRVYVDVPDSLDMYEVRLYAMANPDAGIGYSLSGLGVPSGDLFDNFAGEYGGFNTSCKGERNVEAMASCEYSGQDMVFVYDTPNSVNATSNIFYYLALIAEHGEGTVEFYVQTDFNPPNITLVEPLERGYAGEETRVEVSVEDEVEVGRVWVEYTDDGGETWHEEELALQGDVYVGDLPPFSPDVYVNYTICAEDDFGNVGTMEGGFPVKNRVTFNYGVSKSKLKAGQKLLVSGTVSPSVDTVTLQFVCGGFNESIEVAPDATGSFSYSYEPRQTGKWSLQALYGGDELNFPASGDPVSFTVEKEPTSVFCSLSSSEVKKNHPVTVSGTVMPSMQGLAVQVVFTSPTSYHAETVVTDASGGFSYSFKPSEVGVWNLLVQVLDDGVHAPSQSDLMELTVAPLTPLDMVVGALLTMVTPPYQYLTIGLAGAGAALAVYKGRDHLTPLFPSLAAGRGKGRVKKRSVKRTQRYRRTKR